MNISNVSLANLPAAAASPIKPQANSSQPAKPSAPAVAKGADSDGDHDGSAGGRVDVKA